MSRRPYIMRKGASTLADLKDGAYAGLYGLKGAKGQVFFVDAGHANTSDGNEGTDPDAPLTTIAKAYSLCVDEAQDVIYVSGRRRYRETELQITKGGLRIIGAGWGTEWNQTVSPTAYVVRINAENVMIANIQISINDQGGGIFVGDTGTGSDNYNAFGCLIENCFIRGDWYNEATRIPGAGITNGIHNAGASLMTVRNNHIWGWATGVHVADGGNRTSYGAHIYDNFISYCKTYGIHFEGYGYTSVIKGNTIWDTAEDVQMTYGIHLANSIGGVLVAGNCIGAGNPVYDSGDLNYWVGNFVENVEGASEAAAVEMEAF